MKTASLIALAGAALALGACTTFNPRPWDKDLMARHEMQVDPNPVQTAADNHVYFSKEASSGGQGFAGGGCGCN
jgi:hypothetical protein